MKFAHLLKANQWYALLTAVLGTFLKHHTPNFGWCRMYPSLGDLLSESHEQLAWGTLGSVMRPSLHIEKALGHACGMGCVNTYYYIVYFLALLISTSMISGPLIALATSKPKSKYQLLAKRSAVFICISLPIYLITFSYGSIVDAIFPASIIGISGYILCKNSRSSPGGAVARQKWMQILGIAMLCFLSDMSRPYAPYVLIVLLASAAAQKNKKAVIGIILGISIALPYHINQFRTIGTPLLTNYSGCNLMEVFNAPGTAGAGGMDQTPQIVIAEKCALNEKKIKSYIISDPLGALKDFTRLSRLSRSALPAPFTPWEYKEFPGFSTAEEILQWSLWAAFIIFLYIPLGLLFSSSVKMAARQDAATILLCAAAALPFLITIISNGGQEAGRVGLSFILPIAFISLRINRYWVLHQLANSSADGRQQTGEDFRCWPWIRRRE